MVAELSLPFRERYAVQRDEPAVECERLGVSSIFLPAAGKFEHGVEQAGRDFAGQG